MSEKTTRHAVWAVAGLLVGFALALLFGGDASREGETAARPVVASQRPELPRRGDPPATPEPRPIPSQAPAPVGEPEPGEWATAPVEAFKRALYELDIDSVDRLAELDTFVAVGDADPRSFWDTDWTGIDDWKDEPDDFRLERTEDGALIFVPGERSRRTYTFFETMNEYAYDEATGEFVYETDFYGKPITNIVKFLREDVMVMMVVSGDKVDLNIYGPGD